MSADAVTIIVALARSAYGQCRRMRQYHTNAVRIGGNLLVLMAATKEWSRQNSPMSLDTMEQALRQVNMALEANTTKKASWTASVAAFMHGTTLLESLANAERRLDRSLQDLRVPPNQHVLKVASSVSVAFESVDITLAKLAQEHDPQHPGKTLEQGMREALDSCSTSSTVSTSSSSMGSSTQLTDEMRIDITQLKCDYSEADLLGEGGFSKVFQGIYKGDTVAIKRIRISRNDIAQATRHEQMADAKRIASETAIAFRCGVHANIVQIYGCYPVISNVDRPLLVMECMTITLFHALRRGLPATFAERRDLMMGIASAIEFLHLQGIVHQDVKSLNILVNADLTIAKLADFGETKVKGLATTRLRHTSIMSATSPSSPSVANYQQAGTMVYQAPEILAEDLQESSRAAEMYSFGVVLWECLTGDVPHRGKSINGLIKMAMTKDLKTMLELPSAPSTLDKFELTAWTQLLSTARLCLHRDIGKRPSASQVVDDWSRHEASLANGSPTLPAAAFSTPLNNPTFETVALEDSALSPGAGNGQKLLCLDCACLARWPWYQRLLFIGSILLLLVVVILSVVLVGNENPPSLSPPAAEPSTPIAAGTPTPTPAPTLAQSDLDFLCSSSNLTNALYGQWEDVVDPECLSCDDEYDVIVCICSTSSTICDNQGFGFDVNGTFTTTITLPYVDCGNDDVDCPEVPYVGVQFDATTLAPNSCTLVYVNSTEACEICQTVGGATGVSFDIPNFSPESDCLTEPFTLYPVALT